jgi:hypothetical protein
MNPIFIFLIQFSWFLIVWTTIARLLVSPAIVRFNENDKLMFWMIPQLFRVLGTGLLVQNLAPDLPRTFALSTAIGDSVTSVLALISIIALHKRWSSARAWVMGCTIVGSADLAIALPHAAAINAANYLTGQWYVPAAIVPLMVVSHIMAMGILFRRPPAD